MNLYLLLGCPWELVTSLQVGLSRSSFIGLTGPKALGRIPGGSKRSTMDIPVTIVQAYWC